jgi:hypothetical protein
MGPCYSPASATRRDFTAREVTGDENAAWWDRAVGAWPDDASDQKRTDRRIPVFVLEPMDQGTAPLGVLREDQMDVVEFRRLTARVVATRNAESRAFLQAFDLALSGWSERTCAKWRAWSRDNDALRGAAAQLEAFLCEQAPKVAKPGA